MTQRLRFRVSGLDGLSGHVAIAGFEPLGLG